MKARVKIERSSKNLNFHKLVLQDVFHIYIYIYIYNIAITYNITSLMFVFLKVLYEFIFPYTYTIYNTCNSCCYMFSQLSSSISSLHLLKFCEVSQTSSVTDLIPQLNYV